MTVRTNKARITLRHKTEAHLLLLPDTWDQLITHIHSRFKLDYGNVVLRTESGALVNDIELIRDGDVLCVQTRGPDTFRENSWITLNVGGHILQTTWHTLTKERTSMLARMFDKGSNWNNTTDNNGAFLIDRSPKYFLPLLDFLRHGELVIDANVNPYGVLLEARYFGFNDLIPKIEEHITTSKLRSSLEPLTRDDVIKSLIRTPSNYILRFRGLDFSGADLSDLDLKHINFTQCILTETDFSRADVYGATFDKANMTGCVFDDAHAAGVSMEGVILDNASLVRCNFEDSKLRPSSLLGAQMKGVNLESANLGGVNLRVANLRGSNLKNCSLKGACLAGADLEGCDLNGAELYNTNMRGANLTNVNFEDITTALHMANIANVHD